MNKTLKILDALSEETRMRVFLLLTKGDLCVCELVCTLKMKQARISHILKKLTDAGLTYRKRDGKWIIYSVSPAVLRGSVVKGIIADLKISASDLRNLKQCRKNGTRESCSK